MTKTQLIENVLNLPLDQRAKLARDIIASLDGPPDSDVPKAWAQEIDRRAQQVREGTVELTSWEHARKRITARLRSRR
jgi:putative addiction module component (TIGR02574 family)